MTDWIVDTGRNNRVEIADGVTRAGGLRVALSGDDNHLVIGRGTRLNNGLIEMRDSRGRIEIGEDCVIGGELRCRADDAAILIGSETTMMQAVISLHEAGTIRLGRDCMLSGGIRMDVSDMHSILDAKTGERINPPEDITVGDHVWIGQGVNILKGASLGDDCIIGARALVDGDVPAGSIAVGVPARVVRTGITWDRRRLPLPTA